MSKHRGCPRLSTLCFSEIRMHSCCALRFRPPGGARSLCGDTKNDCRRPKLSELGPVGLPQAEACARGTASGRMCRGSAAAIARAKSRSWRIFAAYRTSTPFSSGNIGRPMTPLWIPTIESDPEQTLEVVSSRNVVRPLGVGRGLEMIEHREYYRVRTHVPGWVAKVGKTGSGSTTPHCDLRRKILNIRHEEVPSLHILGYASPC